MYLLLACQTGQRAAGLPVRNDPPRVLVRGEEAHDPAWDHVTDVGENAPRLVHLRTHFAVCERCSHIQRYYSKKLDEIARVCLLPCVESLCSGK